MVTRFLLDEIILQRASINLHAQQSREENIIMTTIPPIRH
jgi:hypothetical protein